MLKNTKETQTVAVRAKEAERVVRRGACHGWGGRAPVGTHRL